MTRKAVGVNNNGRPDPDEHAFAPRYRTVYVGCRTTEERQARGEGLTAWRIGPNGGWTQHQIIGLTNPSWVVVDQNGRHLYTVEGDGNRVHAYRIGTDGDLEHMNTVSSGGENPVFAVIHGQRSLLIANYGTGTIADIPIHPNGHLGAPRKVIWLGDESMLEGASETASHPHQIVVDPDSDIAYVPDKGLDTVFVLALTAEGPTVSNRVRVQAGSGPRHAIRGRHPAGLLYVVGELDSSLMTFEISRDGGDLLPRWRTSTLPESVPTPVENTASAIAMSPAGRTLYVSNRGHDSISCFSLLPSGEPRLVQNVHCLGEYPRFMRVDNDVSTLLVANEQSDTIVSFAIDPADGCLNKASILAHTGSPVCITPNPSSCAGDVR